MPIYEYQCQSCQEQLEALQKLSDDPLIDCPKCGKPSLRKKISAAAFRLKGSGWYETDFKTGNKKNLVGGGESTGTGDKAATASSSESKSSESKSSETKASTSKSGDSKNTA
jgi:putative FmdB family regulatory protein